MTDVPSHIAINILFFSMGVPKSNTFETLKHGGQKSMKVFWVGGKINGTFFATELGTKSLILDFTVKVLLTCVSSHKRNSRKRNSHKRKSHVRKFHKRNQSMM